MTRRSGLVILAVLLLVMIGALVGTTALHLARAESAGVAASLGRGQARALAWSGVQIALAELADQRPALLQGRQPRLTESAVVFDDGGRRGMVRLAGGPASEAGKLPLNLASASMLEALGAEPTVAQAIVSARAARGGQFDSAEDLLGVEGVTPELADTLANAVSVFHADPNQQAGLGGGRRFAGEPRINVNTKWSDDLRARLERRLGGQAADAVKQLMASGRTFPAIRDIVDSMVALKLDVGRQWPEALDALATTDEPFLYGLVDLLTAPAEVLAALPGLDRSAADRIVAARTTLDDRTRATVAWPVMEGIVEPGRFAEAVDRLTTRSLQWRVRVEAGFATGDSLASRPDLRDRVVLEAVLDVSGPVPRVAYLRDLTMLDTLRALTRAGVLAETSQPEPREQPAAEGTPPTGAASAPDPGSGGPEAVPPPQPLDRRLGRWRAPVSLPAPPGPSSGI
ncbi:MAG: helix-hairpin-helix domain-containing protein [Phycisphaerales bacterium]|nr:helix-hairpin-helix domain-containing protein [Phycisphaerales bacterium]